MAGFDRARWQSLEPLLDHALDLSPEERRAWLDTLSRESPAVAADLAALLESEAEADESGFLATSFEPAFAGIELGDWKLERPLGQGGMGTVWLASRADGRFEGKAAVKILNHSFLAAPGRERFHREGSMLARLEHPGIARLLDAGLSPSGQPYLVLEHVDGKPIDVFAGDCSLSLDARIQLFLQVLAAVEHAHAQLVIHRDLKPSNMLVTADGRVKLLDFGIAKLLDGAPGAGDSSVTLESGRALTPRHAAPEQVRGEPLSTATDVYALGVLLYLLVSGKHPTSDLARTPAESVQTLLEVEPARLGLGDLDNILAKALRKLPAERYQTVTALADDLRRYLRAEPVSARGHSLGYRIERFTRRNAMPLAAGVLIGAGLIASTIYSLAERREAERQRDTALAERRRADIQVDFQNVLLSSVGDRAMTMREVLDSARSVLGERRWSDERTHAALLLQLAGNYRELGDTRVRPVLLARADSIAVEIGDRALLARARCDLADLLRKHGEYPEAVRAADSALTIARESGDASMLAYCLDVRSVILGETRKGAAAVADAREAVALKDSLGETHELLYFDILSDLAYALDVDRQSRRAVALQRRVLAAKDSAGQRYTVNFAIARHNLALMLMSLGETAEAEQLFHASLVTFRQSADTSWISPQALIHYAEAALRQGHADSALATFELLIRQARSDSNLWWEGRGRYGAARADVLLGRLDDAARANARLTHILKMQPKLRETENALPDDDEVRGMMELARNDGAAATASFMKALRTNGYFEGKDSVRLRPVVSLLARSALLAGDTHAAIEYARQAIAIARVDSLADFRSAYVGEARLVEAEALLRAGDTATARTEAMRAAVALGVGAGELDSRTIEARALVSRLMR